MRKYQLIAFDMDGTLLDQNKQITLKTQQAIARALRFGKTVILSTGRGLDELKVYQSILKDIRYFICESGALIYDNFEHKILYANQMDAEVVKEIMQIISGRDTMLYYLANGRGYTEIEKIDNMDHYDMTAYQSLLKENVTLVPNITEHIQQHLDCIEKMNIFTASHPECNELAIAMSHLPIMLANAEPNALEVNMDGISKASGLKILCEYLNIPLEQTIAVGDSSNDLEIMQVAGLSIGMGNSVPAVKNICNVIVADNEHDGCVEAIDKYLIA